MLWPVRVDLSFPPSSKDQQQTHIILHEV